MIPAASSVLCVHLLLASKSPDSQIFSPHGVGMTGSVPARDSTSGVILDMTSCIGHSQNSTDRLSICRKSKSVMKISIRSTKTVLVSSAISLNTLPLIVKSAMSDMPIVVPEVVELIFTPKS